MRYSKTILVALLFIVGNLYSQLDISLYTNKSNYEYGEKIELSCKITNLADTTFQFLAGTHSSCQAEFSFNDFNSWEHTACLATTELLTFKPYSSKIYSWTIDPVIYGLPNNEGDQMIIGTYYFDLVDTIYIEAPQFLGGQVNVGFLPANSDSVQSIKDSLNVTVLNHSDYGTVINELWQVEGFQIDSVINYFQYDSILTYIEKAVFVEYDSIIDENPLEYFPLQIGNQWTYKVFDVNTWENDTSDTYYYRTDEVISNVVLNDGYNYFEIKHGEISDYLRVDPITKIIYNSSGYEFYNLGVNPDSLWVDNAGVTNNMYYDTSRVGELNIIRPMMVYQQGYFFFNRTLAKGIGLSFVEYGDLGLHTLEILVHAKIDGVEYKSIDTSQNANFFPLQIGNRWQYSEGLGEVLESKAIGDTTMSNSLTYIKVQGVFFRGYFRKENSRIYSYNTLLNEEELIYDFSLKVGDTLSVKIIDQDTIVTTVSSEGIEPIFGEDRKYMTFLYDDINSSGDFERKVVDGIGFVQFYGEVFSYGLTGAVIDSVSYGSIVNVEKPNKSLPSKYSLSQNYPNPFNPSTTIKYSIPNVEAGHAPTVQLKVYDVLGREVATLVNKEQSPGNYEVQFDASSLTSGIYFYKLQSGTFVESRKMMLLK